jgi:hypothetical protein
MKAQSTIKPEMLKINKLGKYQELILCENIVETINNENGIIYEYDLTLRTSYVNNKDGLISTMIKLKYSIDDEFALINKGISDPLNNDYIRYREYVNWCKEQANIYFSEV